jgi:hypothetical protein
MTGHLKNETISENNELLDGIERSGNLKID